VAEGFNFDEFMSGRVHENEPSQYLLEDKRKTKETM
jgi:hypothetical protein